MSMNIIYALTDPRFGGEIRYVGMTTKGMSRTKKHLSEARSDKNTHKLNWIRSLVKDEKEYGVLVLEEVDDSSLLPELQIQWIEYFRSLGVRLTNVTDGGDGVLNPSNATREKMRRSHSNVGVTILKEKWQDKGYRRVRMQKMKKVMASSEYKKKVSNGVKQSWKDEVVREKRIAKNQSRSERNKRREESLSRWEDPVYRQKVSDGLKRAWEQRKKRETVEGSYWDKPGAREKARQIALGQKSNRDSVSGRFVKKDR